MKKILPAFMLGIALATTTVLSACAETPTKESTGQFVDSSAITAKVKSALLNTPNLNSSAINVETYKGIVQLSGFVNSKAQANLAEQTAREVEGVKSVKNNLVVKSEQLY